MKSRNVTLFLALAFLLLGANSALASRCCQTATGCFDTENEELCKSCGGSLNFIGFCGEDGMCQDTAPNPASSASSDELTCPADVSPMAAQIDIGKLICKLIETPKTRQAVPLNHNSSAEDQAIFSLGVSSQGADGKDDVADKDAE